MRTNFRRHRSLASLGLLLATALGCGAATSETDDVAVAPDASAASDASRSEAATPNDASADAVARDAPGADAVPTPPACPCFDGPGTYCEADVAARARADNCTAANARATGTRLLACAAGAWTAEATCASGCESGEEGAGAQCSLPVCDCFVRASWCGSSAARHGLTLDPPCRVPLVPEHDTDILGCNGNTWVVLERCTMGCNEAPTGTPDSCVTTRTPTDPGWADCAHLGLLHSGLHPEASDRLRCAGVTSGQISQTIGYASASAGYHAPDGTVDGMQYTAAVDLRTAGLSETAIANLLTRLGENGFAAWYRKPGFDGWPASEVAHVHAVFAGVVMKAELRGQVRDYLAGLNGLATHSPYRFWHPTAAILTTVRLLFSRHYSP